MRYFPTGCVALALYGSLGKILCSRFTCGAFTSIEPSSTRMAHLHQFRRAYIATPRHHRTMEPLQNTPSSVCPSRSDHLSTPFTSQVPTTVPASNPEISVQYTQPHYNHQQFSPPANPAVSPYYGQTAMLYHNQTFGESDPSAYYAQPNVSYPNSPVTNALSPDYSPRHNPVAYPFQQHVASGFGVPYFSQPDQSSQPTISPVRQDHTSMRSNTSHRPQYNPTAAPFSSSSQNVHITTISSSSVQDPNIVHSRGLSTFRLARPPARRVQHSPPRRAFHESSSPPRTPQIFRDIALRDRIKALQDKRKQALENFCFSGEKVKFSQKELDGAWDSDVADQHTNDLLVMQTQLTQLVKQHDEYGKEWKKLGEDIDELFGDLMVPGESEMQKKELAEPSEIFN